MSAGSTSSPTSSSSREVGDAAGFSSPLQSLTQGETCTYYAQNRTSRCRLPRSCQSCLTTAGCMINGTGWCVDQDEESFVPVKDFEIAIKEGLSLPDPTANASLQAVDQVWQFRTGEAKYCTPDEKTCRRCVQNNFWRARNSYPDSHFCVGEGGCVCIDACERRWYVQNDCPPRAVSSPSPTPEVTAESSYYLTNTNDADSLRPGLVGAIVFALVFLLTVICLGKKSEAREHTEREERRRRQEGRRQRDSGHIFAWWKDDILLSHRLDAGAISDVREIGRAIWLVNYRTRTLVSKRLVRNSGKRILKLAAEAKVVSTLRYASIVPFVGVAWTKKTDFQVLYEFMSNGNLGVYLARTSESLLRWHPWKLQFAIDVIEALVYTHSFNPPLLHRDLKASNVLLDDDFNAKLGNFGCARQESESNTMTTGGAGSGRWLAPEILLGSKSYGTPSDIYSFGVMVCELDTHHVPYGDQADDMSESALLQRVARGALRPSLSPSCPTKIREIAEACLASDPSERPTAMQVAFTLRALRTTGTNE